MSNPLIKFSLDKTSTEVEVREKIKILKEKGVKSLSSRPSSSCPQRTTFYEDENGKIEVEYNAIMKVLFPNW